MRQPCPRSGYVAVGEMAETSAGGAHPPPPAGYGYVLWVVVGEVTEMYGGGVRLHG
jgi:hypothetical protein